MITVSLLTYIVILSTASITIYKFTNTQSQETISFNDSTTPVDIWMVLVSITFGVVSMSIVLGLQLLVVIFPWLDPVWPTIPVTRVAYTIGLSSVLWLNMNFLILLTRNRTSIIDI